MENWIINKINLRPEEEIVQVVRRYFLTLWPNILVGLLFILFPFFFLFPLFRLGYWGVIIFLFSVLFGIIYCAYKLAIWYLNVFVITSERVIDIDQKGIFDRVVSEVPSKKIKDVSYRIKGIWQTIFHYGRVRVQTDLDKLELEALKVKNPEAIQKIIQDMAHLEEDEDSDDYDNDFDEGDGLTDHEFKLVEESVQDMDEEQLENIYKKIKGKLRETRLKDFDDLRRD